jgi:hypothetical protein
MREAIHMLEWRDKLQTSPDVLGDVPAAGQLSDQTVPVWDSDAQQPARAQVSDQGFQQLSWPVEMLENLIDVDHIQ